MKKAGILQILYYPVDTCVHTGVCAHTYTLLFRWKTSQMQAFIYMNMQTYIQVSVCVCINFTHLVKNFYCLSLCQIFIFFLNSSLVTQCFKGNEKIFWPEIKTGSLQAHLAHKRFNLAHTGLFSHLSLNPCCGLGPSHRARHISECPVCPFRNLNLQSGLRPLTSQLQTANDFPKSSQQHRQGRNSHQPTPSLQIKLGGRTTLSP